MKNFLLVFTALTISFPAFAASGDVDISKRVPECDIMGFDVVGGLGDCDSSDILPCPANAGDNTAKYFCAHKCRVGDILYSDMTCHSNGSNKNPIGVVFDEENQLAIALENYLENGHSNISTWATPESIYATTQMYIEGKYIDIYGGEQNCVLNLVDGNGNSITDSQGKLFVDPWVNNVLLTQSSTTCSSRFYVNQIADDINDKAKNFKTRGYFTGALYDSVIRGGYYQYMSNNGNLQENPGMGAQYYCYTNLNAQGTTYTYKGRTFLPSIGDLYTLYQNKAAVNSALVSLGLPSLSNSVYWSSTEADEIYAWWLDMGRGALSTQEKGNYEAKAYNRCAIYFGKIFANDEPEKVGGWTTPNAYFCKYPASTSCNDTDANGYKDGTCLISSNE